MRRNRPIAMLLQLGPQGGMLVWGDGAPTARRNPCGEGISLISAAAREEPLNGGQTDTKGGYDFRTRHPALNRCHNPLA